jgi:hypothetical protein
MGMTFNKYFLKDGDATYENRKELCNDCEYYSSVVKICEKCHCFIPMKMRLAWQSCPIDKWKATKDEPIDPETGAHYIDQKYYALENA